MLEFCKDPIVKCVYPCNHFVITTLRRFSGWLITNLLSQHEKWKVFNNKLEWKPGGKNYIFIYSLETPFKISAIMHNPVVALDVKTVDALNLDTLLDAYMRRLSVATRTGKIA